MITLLPIVLFVNVCEALLQTGVITTSTGRVQGVIESSSVKDIKVVRFSNIPYAEAPVGDLRFSKPVAKKPWGGILGKSTDDIACWQQWKSDVTYTEDCLVLNIWTPFPSKTNLSVMVWIHGGSFTDGKSGDYPGHNLVAVGDVILVTVNYRLSFLGFLSTGDERIKGNFGMFDQRLAMEWVKNNIVHFGGNPESITLFGMSAGAAMVSAHTISKKSWPFFNKVIIQSGNMLTPWSVGSPSLSRKIFRLLISYINCTDDVNLRKCLRDNINSTILERMFKSKPFIFQTVNFQPLIDGDFLTDHPNTLWRKKNIKKCDAIFGVTKYETLYWYLPLIQTTRNVSVYNKTFYEELDKNLKNYSSPEIRKQALELYEPKCLPTFVEALKPLLEVQSDIMFVCPIAREASLRSQYSNDTSVFQYQFSYSSPLPWKWFSRGTYGLATHGADTVAQFGSHINNSRYPSEDQIISMRIILYITNFAKSGDPNIGINKLPITIDNVESLPHWPKFTLKNKEYLDMESLSRMIPSKGLRRKQCEFWKDPVGFTAENYKTKPTHTSSSTKHVASNILTLFVLSLFYR